MRAQCMTPRQRKEGTRASSAGSTDNLEFVPGALHFQRTVRFSRCVTGKCPVAADKSAYAVSGGRQLGGHVISERHWKRATSSRRGTARWVGACPSQGELPMVRRTVYQKDLGHRTRRAERICCLEAPQVMAGTGRCRRSRPRARKGIRHLSRVSCHLVVPVGRPPDNYAFDEVLKAIKESTSSIGTSNNRTSRPRSRTTARWTCPQGGRQRRQPG